MNKVLPLSVSAMLAAAITGSALAQTVVTVTPSPTGAYDRLSAGQKKIADALYASQSGPVVMSRDQIAAARRDAGWGQVFHHMQAEGWTDARNLGEVVSSTRHADVSAGTRAGISTSRSTAVVTAGGGRSGSSGGRHGRNH